ncbi:hypothetical protein [Chelativorans xinjiangense]|uniref:hypothetical protein n=1 Tax=Chelativorans xinjiangense TaxID=2681485 RepID=UPI00135B3E52|nr:hypothetical protein [Chelativorans xinjiangense]
MMTDRCERLGKWIGGCRFEARYDLGPPDLSRFKSFERATLEFFEIMKPKTYVHDVCVRCGKIVKRETE